MAKRRRVENPRPAPIPQSSDSRRWILAAILLVGTGLRIWAAQDAFWLDEIWSLTDYALRAASPVDILARMPDSNNHHLITLWMYACGLQRNWFVYRIPSLVAGVGTILLSWQIARTWGSVSALAAAALSASSFVLVTYASEARGYALAGFFALASFWILDRYLSSGGWRLAVAFGLTVALGFLSHLTMIFFYAGALAWSLVTIVKRSPSWRQAMLDVARCHAVAIVCLATFYSVSLREYRVEGAPPYVMSQVVEQTLAIAVGFASRQPAPLAACGIAAVGLAIAALVYLWRERNDVWVFFAVATFVAPGLLLLTRPSALFERFFYVSIVFYLLLLSYLLGRVFQSGSLGRMVSVATLAFVILGNAYLNYRFLDAGRGQYPAAMLYMAEHSYIPEIHVQSDHDFRNPIVLAFYASELFPDRQFRYHPGWPSASDPAEWTILHAFEPDFRPLPVVTDALGNEYELKGLFPYTGLSGFHWALYQRKGIEPRPVGFDDGTQPQQNQF